MSAELSAAVFEALLNESFRLTLGDEAIEAELIQVRGLRSDTKRADRSPFSILFRGPEGVSFDQQIVGVEHAKLGQQQIFLVPIGPDPDHESRGMLYEAVFT